MSTLSCRHPQCFLICISRVPMFCVLLDAKPRWLHALQVLFDIRRAAKYPGVPNVCLHAIKCSGRMRQVNDAEDTTKPGVGFVPSGSEALEGARHPNQPSVRRYRPVLVSAGEPFVLRAVLLGLGWPVGPAEAICADGLVCWLQSLCSSSFDKTIGIWQPPQGGKSKK
jgi:hypothetical protein